MRGRRDNVDAGVCDSCPASCSLQAVGRASEMELEASTRLGVDKDVRSISYEGVCADSEPGHEVIGASVANLAGATIMYWGMNQGFSFAKESHARARSHPS